MGEKTKVLFGGITGIFSGLFGKAIVWFTIDICFKYGQV